MRRPTITTRLLAAAALAGVLVAGAPASAEQASCRDLEARLASVTRGGDRQKVRRYERAIISQRQQLERVQIRQKNAGCASFLASIKPQCSEIRSTVAKMERNLLQLQRTKNELAGGDASREKARILAALNEGGCRGGAQPATDEKRPTGLFARLFGEDGSSRPERNGAAESRQSASITIRNGTVPPGNYRTLCVRTCDGYFFPIAYSSSPQLFDRDATACEAMCPGTPVELYYHRVPDEETDAMVSTASGEPYTALPTAFAYREPGYERAEACRCNPPKAFSIIAGNLPEQTAGDEPAADEVSLQMTADPAEDPEARANREGGLTTSAIAELLAPKIAARTDDPQVEAEAHTEADSQRRIRVVGPAFLPDPEGAIDLRAPGRTELR